MGNQPSSYQTNLVRLKTLTHIYLNAMQNPVRVRRAIARSVTTGWTSTSIKPLDRVKFPPEASLFTNKMISEIQLHKDSLVRLIRLHKKQSFMSNPIRFFSLIKDQQNHEIRVATKIGEMIRREAELDDRMGQ